jgi:O-succinylbenzoic acid--CoA ligase
MSRSALAVSRICEKYASETALCYDDHRITCCEFHEQILKTAAGLKKAGIKKGNRIALLAENSLHLPLLIFALFSLGAVAIPLNFRFPPQQINTMLRSVNCRLIFISKKYKRKFANLRLPVIQIEKFISELKHPGSTAGEINLKLDQAATIIFTSGSSGHPKAALHTIGNHYYNALGSNENISIKPGDRWLLTLPLFHVGGMAILFRTILTGATSVLMSGNKSLADVIAGQNITHLSVVPTQLYRLLAEKISAKHLRPLQAILLGGGPSADTLIKKAVRKQLPLYLTYGLTEMASQVATTKNVLRMKRPDARNAGQVLLYRKLKVNNQGEILVKGLTLFKGYIKNRKIYLPLDKNGWFHTGDLGRIDFRGNLFVLGRKDNMFISGGENIYPEEIERYLKEINGIANALVVPVADKEFGQQPAAFIKFVKNKKIGVKQIVASLQKKIARYKIPRFFLPWPKNYNVWKPQREDFMNLARITLIVDKNSAVYKMPSCAPRGWK